MSKFMEGKLLIIYSIGTVSYTHLDVYKRQVYDTKHSEFQYAVILAKINIV